MSESAPTPEPHPLVGRNVGATRDLQARINRRSGPHAKSIAGLTRRLGRPVVLYGILGCLCFWIALNLTLPKLGRAAIDPPPFFWLQGLTGLSALIASITILIGQNRQSAFTEHRDELELQVTLLVEQRTAKLISLIEELRRDLPNVRNRGDAEADQLAVAASPQVITAAVEKAMQAEEETGEEVP